MENHNSGAVEHEQIPLLCTDCRLPISQDNAIFCPDCRDAYHRTCWGKNREKCIVHDCKGTTRHLKSLDKLLIRLWGPGTKLDAICENCSTNISILARYCNHCGNEVNSQKTQNETPFFKLATKIQNSIKLISASAVLSVALILFWVMPNSMNPDPKLYATQTPDSLASASKPTRTQIAPRPTSTRVIATDTTENNDQSPSLPPVTTSVYCSGAPATRVEINDLAKVITTNGERLMLRSSPEFSDNNIMYRLESGTLIKIWNGPYCVDNSSDGKNYWFWEVRPKGWSRDWIGYVAEGEIGEYYIKPTK